MVKIDRELMIRLAAYLRSKPGTREHGPGISEQDTGSRLEDIGSRLGGISNATVSMLLKNAREAGLIEEKVVYTGGELSAEEEDTLHTLTFQSVLYKQIVERVEAIGHGTAPRVYLYDLRAEGGEDVAVSLRARAFANRAAPDLRRLLARPSVKTIGVSWGGGIAATVDALLSPEHTPTRADDPIKVVALCGEPLDDRPTHESSSAIAENLSLALNGSRDHAKTLGITPAYIPTESEAGDLIWRYIVSTKPYLEVFGPMRLPESARPKESLSSRPLCESLDAFLTSVSIENGTLGYGAGKIYRPEYLDPDEISKAVFGDFGGIPLPRDNLSDDQKKTLEKLKTSWTGVTRECIEDCMKKAKFGHRSARPPGTVLIAVGKQKARGVFQAVVRESIVNHLFLDYECAQEFSHLLK